MQLKQIARDALLKPLQAVSGIVERRHTLPILANVLLEQREGRLYVTATDLEMQITAYSELEGKDGQATTVGARKLQDLLRALPDDATLNLEVTDQQQDDGPRRALALQPADAACRRLSAHQPRHRAAADAVAAAKVICASSFKLAEFAMAQQDIRYYLNGMLLVIDKGSRCRPSPRMAIACRGPASRCRRLSPARKSSCRARRCSSWASCSRTRRSRHRSTSWPTRCASASPTSSWSRRWSTASFPTTTASSPSGTRQGESSSTADRCCSRRCSARPSCRMKSSAACAWCSATNQLKIICTNSEQEEAEEELEVAYQGDALDIGFNITYLLDALQQPGRRAGASLRSATPTRARSITMPGRDDYKYVVMPMRI